MKRLTMLLLGIFTVVLLTTSLQVGAQQTECAGTLQTHRLVVGWRGRILPGDPNSVREQPGGSRLLGQIRSGEEFAVLDGPQCADDLLWWHVDYDGLVGWTAQGDSTTAWIESIVPTAEPSERIYLDSSTNFEGFDVSFSADATLFNDVNAHRGSAHYSAPYSPNPPIPPRRLFGFGRNNNQSLLVVYSVRDLGAFYGSMPETVVTLGQLLDEAPDTVNLPALNQDDQYADLADYIQFQNGSGYRYITSVAENDEPTTNAGHFYRYYGLTSDRQFYIELHIPITLPTTTDAVEYASAVLNRDLGRFQRTRFEVMRNPTLIRPSLSLMDAFVASINIQDAAQTVTPLAQFTPTPLPPPTITPTPSPVPTATSTPDGCFITATNAVNLRSGRDITDEIVRVLAAGETVRAIRRYTAGGGFYIYETEDAGFVHEDFTTESGLCSILPVVES